MTKVIPARKKHLFKPALLESTVATILPFKKKSLQEKHRGSSLCRDGFHKWRVVTAKQFDVKQGRLVTVSECARCGVRKTQAL